MARFIMAVDRSTGVKSTRVDLAYGGPSGVASLDSGGKIPVSQLPATVAGALNYVGTWNAATNTPTLADGTGTQGSYYKVATPGNTTINGNSNWTAGDLIIYNGATWDKVEGGSPDVISVAGLVGTITLANLVTAGLAPINDANLTGIPVVPTAAPGTNTTQIASTAFVQAAVGAGGAVSSVFSRTGAIVPMTGDYTVAQITGAAPLASPALTGIPVAPTAATSDNSTQIATTAFVKAQGYTTGAPTLTRLTQSTSYTILGSDSYVVYKGTGDATFTLPVATTSGKQLVIKHSGSGILSIDPAGTETIDGSTQVIQLTQYQSLTIIADGTSDWEIL